MKKKLRLKDFKKACDDWSKHPINVRLLGPLSSYVAYFCYRFLPITPNQISFIWGIIGVIAAVIMALGGYLNILIGILVYHFAIFLDYLDGQMARASKNTTLGGTYLDRLFHYMHRGLLLLGLGIGLYNETGNAFYLYSGIAICLLFTWDNLAKVKVYETLINERMYENLKQTKKKYISLGNQEYFGTFKQRVKAYTFEMLRPNNPFSLIFFAAVFGLSKYYFYLMAIIAPIFFLKTMVEVYRQIGNTRPLFNTHDEAES